MSSRTSRPVKRRASRPKAAEPAPAPAKPPFARGNPLTHSVTFSDRSGTCWLVYVEQAPTEPALWPSSAVLPGRRLRFDSAATSVAAAPVPAGAPFLREGALQELLDQAQLVDAPARAGVDAGSRGDPRPLFGRRAVAAPGGAAREASREHPMSAVEARSGWHLSRLVSSVALVLMIIRDMILPRGRG